MAAQESTKPPSSDPEQILTDAGLGFVIGGIGGTAFHFLKGGAEAVRMNVPGVAGRWATWFGLYSTFDYALEHARQKESGWNSILAAGAASGLISMRQGFLPMGKAALGGALCMDFIKGVTHTFELDKPEINAQQQQKIPTAMIREAPVFLVPPKVEDTLSQFGGFVEEVKSYVKDTVLERCDPPMVPNFDFV